MIDQTILIPGATAQALYDALLDSKTHSEITGDTAKIEPEVGGAYTTFSGYSSGKTTLLVPGKRIEQTWRASDWPAQHFSTICFDFTDTEMGAEIHFTQSQLPEGTEAEFVAGWEENYWQPLKTYFANS